MFGISEVHWVLHRHLTIHLALIPAECVCGLQLIFTSLLFADRTKPLSTFWSVLSDPTRCAFECARCITVRMLFAKLSTYYKSRL